MLYLYCSMGCPRLTYHQNPSPLKVVYSAKSRHQKIGANVLYFGARYYDSEVSVWLSVDPMADLYPMLSPYAYVANNPVMFFDPDGNIIALVATSHANKPGAGPLGHMAVIVGNENIGYHIFSIELPGREYVKDDEEVYTGSVSFPWSLVSDEYILYSHKEETYEKLKDYMSKNAPGAKREKGNGYDRIISLNNVTEEDEEGFLAYMQSRSSDDEFLYDFLSNNCSSHSMDMINQYFGNIINDKTWLDVPNWEFNNISKDTRNWTVLRDAKNPQTTNTYSNDIKLERELIMGSEGYEN